MLHREKHLIAYMMHFYPLVSMRWPTGTSLILSGERDMSDILFMIERYSMQIFLSRDPLAATVSIPSERLLISSIIQSGMYSSIQMLSVGRKTSSRSYKKNNPVFRIVFYFVHLSSTSRYQLAGAANRWWAFCSYVRVFFHFLVSQRWFDEG